MQYKLKNFFWSILSQVFSQC